jgi:hypothetical protein
MDMVIPQVGLFRALSGNPKHRPRSSTSLLCTMSYNGGDVQLHAAAPLNAQDLKILLVIVALAGMNKNRFNRTSTEPPFKALWSKLTNEGNAADNDALVTRTTAYEILQEVGLSDTGPNRRRLTNALISLSTVREIVWKGKKVSSGSNLLSFGHDEENGNLLIGLTPHIACFILGDERQHVRVSLEEVRSLDLPAAVIIHVLLSARVRPGAAKPARYGIGTLADTAYGPSTNASTSRGRRQKILRAMDQISDLALWDVSYENDNVLISRQKQPIGGLRRYRESGGANKG